MKRLFRHEETPLHVVLAVAFLLGIAVLLADWGSIELTRYSGRIAAVWLANGIVVATLLRVPTRSWGYLLAAAFLANLAADLLSGDSLAVALWLSFANTVETLVVAGPLRRFKLDKDIRSVRSVVVFLALALCPAPLLSALVAAATLAPPGSQDFFKITVDWYSADAVGLALIVPIGTLVHWREFRDSSKRASVPAPSPPWYCSASSSLSWRTIRICRCAILSFRRCCCCAFCAAMPAPFWASP